MSVNLDIVNRLIIFLAISLHIGVLGCLWTALSLEAVRSVLI